MSTFIELLRQHHHALKHHYHAQINGDMHRAIGAMLRCKTERQGRSQWFCSHCHHDYRFLVVIVIALNANNAPLLTGFSVRSKSGYLFTISW